VTSPYFPALVVGRNTVGFAHLEPRTLIVATASRPAGVSIDVVFSNHCFSESFNPTTHFGAPVDVWDGAKRRVFDQIRYTLSLDLPGIVDALPISPVFRTPEANFVRITAPAGAPDIDYRIFFRLERAGRGARHDLKLRVESAYNPNPGQAVPTRDMTKVRFVMLVDKTLRGERISRHQKR
jgi:hypothetical protein